VIESYRARGWVPIPIPRGAKAPTDPAWQRRTLDAPWPAGDCNIGVLLGEPSGGLIDVDLWLAILGLALCFLLHLGAHCVAGR